MSERRTYTAEFKREAVTLSHTMDKSVAQIARELGIRVELLYRWRSESAELEGEAFPGHGKRPALEAENAQLRREVARLEQEREILKKALLSCQFTGVNGSSAHSVKALTLDS